MLPQGGRRQDVRVSQEAKASQALKDTWQLKRRARVTAPESLFWFPWVWVRVSGPSQQLPNYPGTNLL